jgi:hypothetical protein
MLFPTFMPVFLVSLSVPVPGSFPVTSPLASYSNAHKYCRSEKHCIILNPFQRPFAPWRKELLTRLFFLIAQLTKDFTRLIQPVLVNRLAPPTGGG